MARTIGGRYQVVGKLGEGMTGEVFRVRSEGREVALKLLKPFPDPRVQDEVVRSFKFEFGFLKDLRHPNVVAIHDFGFDDASGRFYFTEELLEGKTIRDFAKKAPMAVIEDLFVQAARGLQAIHRANLLHGDLKAGNIYVVETAQGPTVKLIDLGLADPRFPVAAGTPATMAPEQIMKEPIEGEAPAAWPTEGATRAPMITERTDLYSLGVVFYELFTGENPFRQESVQATYDAHLKVTAPKATLLNPQAPAYFNEILETLLAKNPQRRYRSAAALLEAIDLAKPRSGKETAKPWRPDRWVERRALLDELVTSVLKVRAGREGAILVVGEAGSGRSRLLQDLKYELQLKGISFDKPIRAVLPEEEEKAVAAFQAGGIEPLVVLVPPLAESEVKDFLIRMSGFADIPQAFVAGLWQKTRGNLGLMVSVLEALAAQNRLVDEQGRWNFSIFREGALIDALPLQPAADTNLEELLRAVPPDDLPSRLHLRARILEKEGWRLIREGKFPDARNRLERALALLEESTVKDEALSIHIQNFIAWLLCQEGKVDEAVALFEEQLKRWQSLEPGARNRVLNNDLGYAYLLKGDAKKAVAALETAQKFYEKIGDAPSRIKGLYNLAEAWAQAGNPKKAVGFYERCAQDARFERNFEILLRAYNGLGKTFHLQKRWDEAMDSYEKGLELARYLKDYPAAATLAQNIGSIQSERGVFDAAHENLNLSLKLLGQIAVKNVHARYLEARAFQELGDLFRRQRKFEEARGYVRDARKLAFDEPSLASFRFWVVLTQCEIERDAGDSEKLQDLLGDLLPLASDDDQKKRCLELSAGLESPKTKDQGPKAEVGSPAKEEDMAALERTRSELLEEISRAQEELAGIRNEIVESTIAQRFAGMKLITQNKEMLETFRLTERVSDTDLAVLIQGESGTGKELIARSLHSNSRRAQKPFVAVNCAALPANLIESELFGYKAGAFTGAARDKKGLMEEASGGTLFLDEIGDLDVALQAKLLRALQEKVITRVGDTKPIPVDFRLVSATHKTVREEVAAGRFRQDLYYRVCEIEIALPPLRERKEDVVLLAQEFLKKAIKDEGSKIKDKIGIGRDLMKVLIDYPWPGNVRELESAMRVAAALRSGSEVKLRDLPESLISRLRTPSPAVFTRETPRPSPAGGEGSTWKEIETLAIAKALLASGFDAKKAAGALGCAASTVYQRLREGRIKDRIGEFEKAAWEFPASATLEEIKKAAFSKAMETASGSPYQAARSLGVSPATMYKWMR
ncbi:MAG TPA: sigma 54-interacting transcriptional regulator [bacterium]|nr:sigma 54-interacting transcriptional regulator [bacterium]